MLRGRRAQYQTRSELRTRPSQPSHHGAFIEGLRAATAPQRFQISTDGFVPYLSAIKTTLSDRCDFAQVIRVYSNADPEGQRRYSPLQPQKEAKLVALAQAKGLSPDALVRQALDGILAQAPGVSPGKEPTRSARGILAKYGPAPSAEEIDQNRAEMFANFARD